MLHYAKVKLKGFALVTVLLFLQVFVLLGLYAIEQSRLALKTGGSYFQHHIILNNAENGLKTAEKNAPACEIPVIEPAKLAMKPSSFWQALSCTRHFQGGQYFYVTEFLGSDPCADIFSQRATAAYFRITLLAVSLHQETSILLQTIIVKPETPAQACHGDHRTVIVGRQMWREL